MPERKQEPPPNSRHVGADDRHGDGGRTGLCDIHYLKFAGVAKPVRSGVRPDRQRAHISDKPVAHESREMAAIAHLGGDCAGERPEIGRLVAAVLHEQRHDSPVGFVARGQPREANGRHVTRRTAC